MNKNILITSAALGLLPGAAYSQSSVILYGLVDSGLNFVNNVKGGRQYASTSSSGEPQGSRWGLKGTENIGNGLTAIVQLENGFDTDTGKFGQSGLEFGRLAIVGLSGEFGRITAGRQFASVMDFVGSSMIPSGIWSGTFGAHPGDVDNLNDSFRVNNAIKYTSVDYSGFTFSGMYSFGGQAGDFNRGSGFGFGAGYAGGPLKLGIAFSDMQNPYSSAYNNGANAVAAVQSPVISGYVSAGSLQIFTMGALYTIGPAIFGADYSNTRFKHLGSDLGNLGATPGLSGTAAFNNFEVHGGYRVTPAVTIYASYDHLSRGSVGSDGSATYNQGALAAYYRLSKRTDVYLIGVYQRASGRDSTGAMAVAALDISSPSSNNHQSAVRVGIRHVF
jgi:predicted porin